MLKASPAQKSTPAYVTNFEGARRGKIPKFETIAQIFLDLGMWGFLDYLIFKVCGFGIFGFGDFWDLCFSFGGIFGISDLGIFEISGFGDLLDFRTLGPRELGFGDLGIIGFCWILEFWGILGLVFIYFLDFVTFEILRILFFCWISGFGGREDFRSLEIVFGGIGGFSILWIYGFGVWGILELWESGI